MPPLSCVTTSARRRKNCPTCCRRFWDFSSASDGGGVSASPRKSWGVSGWLWESRLGFGIRVDSGNSSLLRCPRNDTAGGKRTHYITSVSKRKMVMPAEALIPVKRQSDKNQSVTIRDDAKSSGFSSVRVTIVLNNANSKEMGADGIIRATQFSSELIAALTLRQAEKLARPPKIQCGAAPLQPGRARNALLLLRWP